MRCRSHPDAIAAGKRASTLRHALVDALSSAATASCLSLGRVFRDLWPARVTVLPPRRQLHYSCETGAAA